MVARDNPQVELACHGRNVIIWENMGEYDHLVKLLLIGDNGVGKTNLFRRFCGESFNKDIGIDYNVKLMEVDGVRVKLQVWDTAGEEKFGGMTKQYFRGAHGVILVFDKKKEKTFQNLVKWLEELKTLVDDVCLCILANDYEPKLSVVEKESGQELAEEHGSCYFEIGPFDDHIIESAFMVVTGKVIQKKQEAAELEKSNRYREMAVVLSKRNNAVQAHKGCC